LFELAEYYDNMSQLYLAKYPGQLSTQN